MTHKNKHRRLLEELNPTEAKEEVDENEND